MSCYTPLKAYARMDPLINKKDIFFAVDHDKPFVEYNGHMYTEKLLIPCGQCIGCRLSYSRQWAVRCVLEAKEYAHNYFVTLTYDDDHVPMAHNFKVNSESAEVEAEFLSLTLVPDHVKKFMKDLRAYCKYHFDWSGIRFYACGEYGSETQRPHYHIILFNMPELVDLRFYKRNFDGDNYYNSETISAVWPYGFSVVANVTYDTCAYVARYMLKKHKGLHRVLYSERGQAPEFSRMSRMPGIGKKAFDRDYSSWYNFDEITITDGKGKPLQVKPPAYYDKLFDHIDSDRMNEIKSHRKEVAEENFKATLSRTSLSEDAYLCLKHKNKIASIKRLPRFL